MTTDRRRPRWVYGTGEDPDYRFSFANERTFLAWIRTALALLAAGVALDAIDTSIDRDWQRALSAALIVLGLASAVAAWVRWASSERAMRHRGSLPSMAFGSVVVAMILAIALLLLLTSL